MGGDRRGGPTRMGFSRAPRGRYCSSPCPSPSWDTDGCCGRVRRPIRWSRHQIEFFAGACAALAVALTWPVADLAAHWSLTALVTQRLILVLAVAPMLLLGLPHDIRRVDHPSARRGRRPRPTSTASGGHRHGDRPSGRLDGSALGAGPGVITVDSGTDLRGHDHRRTGALAPGVGSRPGHPPAEADGPVRLSRRPGGRSGLFVIRPDPGAASPVRDLRQVANGHRAPPTQRPADRRIRLEAGHAHRPAHRGDRVPAAHR